MRQKDTLAACESQNKVLSKAIINNKTFLMFLWPIFPFLERERYYNNEHIIGGCVGTYIRGGQMFLEINQI